MPSFDVVSEVNMQEIDNAVNQALQEIAQRYDFRGSKTELKLEKDVIHILTDDDYKARSVIEMLRQRCAKRGVDLKALDVGEVEPGPAGMVKCDVQLRQGITGDQAREMVKMIKNLKIKVQAQIQDDQVRVIGKKRDDLQEVMGHLKAAKLDLPIQFTNFRD